MITYQNGVSHYSQSVPNQVLFTFECLVENICYAENLLLVAFHGTGKFLVMVPGKPDILSVVGTLTRHLEVQPLLQVELLGRCGDTELVFLIIRIDDVLDDGARFPQCDASIWVLDGWQSAIWVEGGVRFLLDGAEVHVSLW